MTDTAIIDQHRLPDTAGQALDRSRSVQFNFDGKRYVGFAGDSIASALYAAGVRTFSRSFKYHRPRGLLCVSGDCPNCLVQVGSEPNVRACQREISEGMSVRSQNRWPSLKRDVMSLIQLVGRFLPAGFYYKTFMRPRVLWPVYETVLRRLSGLGQFRSETRWEPTGKIYLHPEVTVVGGGPAGIHAAIAAADRGAKTLLLEGNDELGGHLRYRRGEINGQDYQAYLRGLIESVMMHPNIEVLTGALALGYYDHNWIGAALESGMAKIRTQKLIVTTGGREIPLVFKNNDLPGVMLPSAAQRLIRFWRIVPGERAVVISANRHTLLAVLDLLDAGVEIAAAADLRAEPDPDLVAKLGDRGVQLANQTTIVKAMGGGRVSEAWLRALPDGALYPIPCDLILASSGLAAANELLFQAGAKLKWDAQLNEYVPSELPKGIFAAGEVAGIHDLETAIADAKRIGARAGSSKGTDVERVDPAEGSRGEKNTSWTVAPFVGKTIGKAFVCFCEDITRSELRQTVEEGYDSVELLKRYSTVSMGPCQGKMCNVAVMHACAQETGRSVAATGTTTSRPPARPTTMRVFAGKPMDPVRYTPLHQWHLDHGAVMMVAGAWMRPEHYGNAIEEVKAVRERVGLIDVSTLGKLHLHGPDVPQLLERIYTNRWRKLDIGRVRYGMMVNDEGVMMDDGVTARLDSDFYYMSTTSSGARTIYEWIEWWLQSGWDLNAHVYEATELRAAINLTGPHARDVLAKVVSGADIHRDAFPYMHARQASVADAPAILLRIGFTGELGFEIHTPSGYGAHVWNALMEAGAEYGIAPFGVEAQRVLRLEKGHLIVGQDTDSLTNPFEAGMGWAVKMEKGDFIGRPSLAMFKENENTRSLVGFEIPSGDLPEEGNQIVKSGSGPLGLDIIGRITSARYSPTLEKVVGLAWVPKEQAEPGSPFTVRTRGELVNGQVVELPFYDPDGARLR